MIREAWSCGNNQIVEIDPRRAESIASALRVDRADQRSSNAWDDPRLWNVDATHEERCQFLAVGNAINFRFWNLQDGRVKPAVGVIEGESLRGSIYMWRRLRLAIQNGELSLDANCLAKVTAESFSRAFADDYGKLPLRPGLQDRVRNLRDLGTRLAARWQGQFANLIKAADGSLSTFVELSSDFRAFDDLEMKLTMVNAIMLVGSNLARFDNDPLPGVDYHLVKQALRQGLVEPAGRLKAKLIGRELLNSEESHALRAAVLEALVDVAQRADVPTTIIDNVYWNNRRVCGDETTSCASCPFRTACAQRTDFTQPLELTRHY